MSSGGGEWKVTNDRVLVWILAGAATALLGGGVVVGLLPGAGTFGQDEPSLPQRAIVMTQPAGTAVWLLLAAAVVCRLTAPLTPTLKSWLIGIAGAAATLSIGGVLAFGLELFPRQDRVFMRSFTWLGLVTYAALAAVAAAVAWWVGQMPTVEPLPPDDTDPEVVDLDDR